MWIKVISVLLLYIPAWIILVLVDLDFNLLELGFKQGANVHLIIYSLVLLVALSSLIVIFNKLPWKNNGVSGHAIMNSHTVRVGILMYTYIFITFIVITFSQSTTTYGRWLRGMKELSDVNEIIKEKSPRELEYIQETLLISKESPSIVDETANRYYLTYKNFRECMRQAK